ncbi:MAG TPA: C39 family peptidase [Terracidiphilus sp.]|nr:C39 family peptidase [Terracidiphilus sp.]
MPGRTSIAVVVAILCCGLVAAAGTAGVWLDVPFVKQDKDGCGAASIAMVMQYWQQHRGKSSNHGAQGNNPNAEYAHIEQALLSRDAHGIFASDMKRYFVEHGYTAFTFAGNMNLMQHHLREGRPLIVALKPGSHLPLHYVVVAGVDEDDHTVLLNDPAQRKLLKQDDPKYEKEWKAAGYWTLLAVPEADSR